MLVWDSNYYAGAKYLMDEEVVFVTMNYRLGALGKSFKIKCKICKIHDCIVVIIALNICIASLILLP